MAYFFAVIICLSLLAMGICFIKFAKKLSDWAYGISDMVGKSVYLWWYRLIGVAAIIFFIVVLYIIFFS